MNNQRFLFQAALWLLALACLFTSPALAAEYNLKDNAVTHARNGQLLMEREQYEEAIEEFKAAIRLNPFASMAAPIYNNLGLAYRATKNYPYAYASFQRACRMQPPFSLYYRNLVETYQMANQLPQMKTQLLALLEDNPDNAEAWFLLGLTYREQGHLKLSRVCFEKFLKLQPEAEMAQAAREALK